MSDAKTVAVKMRASKKLNVKKIHGDVKAAIIAAGGRPDQLGDDGRVVASANWVELIRVVGIVSGFRVGTTQYGNWISFTGDDLAAINSVNGEIYKGRELLLPDEATILLTDPVKQAVLDGKTVKVALAVEAQLTRTVVGYQYRVNPLMPIEAAASEALSMLLEYGGDKARDALPMLIGNAVNDEDEGEAEAEPSPVKAKIKKRA